MLISLLGNILIQVATCLIFFTYMYFFVWNLQKCTKCSVLWVKLYNSKWSEPTAGAVRQQNLILHSWQSAIFIGPSNPIPFSPGWWNVLVYRLYCNFCIYSPPCDVSLFRCIFWIADWWPSQYWDVVLQVGITIIKIRHSQDRLILIMEIPCLKRPSVYWDRALDIWYGPS